MPSTRSSPSPSASPQPGVALTVTGTPSPTPVTNVAAEGVDAFGCRLPPEWVRYTLLNATAALLQWGPTQAPFSAPAAATNVGADDPIEDGLGYSRQYGGCRLWALAAFARGSAADAERPRWTSPPLSSLLSDRLVVTTADRAFATAVVYDVRVALVCSGGQPCRLGTAGGALQFPSGPALAAPGGLAAASPTSVSVAWAPFAFSADLFSPSAPLRGHEFGGAYAVPGSSFLAVALSLAPGAPSDVPAASRAAAGSPATVEGLQPDTPYLFYVEQRFLVDVGPGFAAASARAFFRTPAAAGAANASSGQTDLDIPVAALFPVAELEALVDALFLPSAAPGAGAGAGAPSAGSLESAPAWTLTVALANVPCSSLTSDLARAILADLRAALNASREEMKYATIRCVAAGAVVAAGRRLRQSADGAVQVSFIVRGGGEAKAAALDASLAALAASAQAGTLLLPPPASPPATRSAPAPPTFKRASPPPPPPARGAPRCRLGRQPRRRPRRGIVGGVGGTALLVAGAAVAWRRRRRARLARALHASEKYAPALPVGAEAVDLDTSVAAAAAAAAAAATAAPPSGALRGKRSSVAPALPADTDLLSPAGDAAASPPDKKRGFRFRYRAGAAEGDGEGQQGEAAASPEREPTPVESFRRPLTTRRAPRLGAEEPPAVPGSSGAGAGAAGSETEGEAGSPDEQGRRGRRRTAKTPRRLPPIRAPTHLPPLPVGEASAVPTARLHLALTSRLGSRCPRSSSSPPSPAHSSVRVFAPVEAAGAGEPSPSPPPAVAVEPHPASPPPSPPPLAPFAPPTEAAPTRAPSRAEAALAPPSPNPARSSGRSLAPPSPSVGLMIDLPPSSVAGSSGRAHSLFLTPPDEPAADAFRQRSPRASPPRRRGASTRRGAPAPPSRSSRRAPTARPAGRRRRRAATAAALGLLRLLLGVALADSPAAGLASRPSAPARRASMVDVPAAPPPAAAPPPTEASSGAPGAGPGPGARLRRSQSVVQYGDREALYARPQPEAGTLDVSLRRPAAPAAPAGVYTGSSLPSPPCTRPSPPRRGPAPPHLAGDLGGRRGAGGAGGGPGPRAGRSRSVQYLGPEMEPLEGSAPAPPAAPPPRGPQLRGLPFAAAARGRLRSSSVVEGAIAEARAPAASRPPRPSRTTRARARGSASLTSPSSLAAAGRPIGAPRPASPPPLIVATLPPPPPEEELAQAPKAARLPRTRSEFLRGPEHSRSPHRGRVPIGQTQKYRTTFLTLSDDRGP
eukprot:tig00001027_g6379.t1